MQRYGTKLQNYGLTQISAPHLGTRGGVRDLDECELVSGTLASRSPCDSLGRGSDTRKLLLLVNLECVRACS